MSRTVPDKESLTVEFKSDTKKYNDSDIFEDVTAFANTQGGDLYLGVEDDGTVTGVHPQHSNPVALAAFIANNTVPPVSVRCEIIHEKKPVLHISVPKSHSIVATRSGKILRRRIKSDNTPENIPMYPSEIPTRLSDLRLLDYSEMVIYEGKQSDIDALEIQRLRNIILAYSGDKALLELNDGELLKALGFVREENHVMYPTVTGILMAGRVDSIKKYVPTARFSFQVLEGTAVRVNNEYVLPVPAAIEKILEQIEPWNPERELSSNMFRISVPEFDKRALREAVVNAFCHRDYSVMGGVRAAISDEGVTIVNPGGFIEGVTIQNLLTAEPRGRNQLLADVLKRIGLAERTGRGIDRIYEGSLIYGRILPDYSNSTSGTVSLLIPRSCIDEAFTKIIADQQKKLGRPLSVNTMLVLNILREKPHSNIKHIALAVNMSEIQVKTIIDFCMESNIVERCSAQNAKDGYMLSRKLYGNNADANKRMPDKAVKESEYDEKVVNMARTNDFITRADVMNLLGVNGGKAYNILKSLADKGVLIPVNKGKYSRYKIN